MNELADGLAYFIGHVREGHSPKLGVLARLARHSGENASEMAPKKSCCTYGIT